MAFENLFIRTKKSIAGIQLDAIFSESHINNVRMTKNPVERGVVVADHAIVEPVVLNIQAAVTDSPLGAQALREIVDTVSGIFGSSTSENTTRSVTAYNAMLALMQAREPIQVQTRLRVYDNMLITKLDTTQDKDTSRIVMMNLTLEEINIVDSVIVQLEPRQLSVGKTRSQGTSAEKKGRVNGNDVGEKTNRSVLRSISNVFGITK